MINPDQAAIARGMRVKNDGDRPVWMQVTARGVPRDPQPAASDGLSVQREYLTLAGETANLAQVRQNDRLIVSVSGRNLEGGYHEVALLDLLPAGFEIEAVLNEETAKSFPFLSKLTETRIAEARDDRFFASFNLGRPDLSDVVGYARTVGNSYHVAYIVRAVTPGTFALPAVNVSDMYAPRVYARSAMGSLTIARAVGTALNEPPAPPRWSCPRRHEPGGGRRWHSTGPSRPTSRVIRSDRREVVDANGRLLRAFTTADGKWRLKTTVDDVDPLYLACSKPTRTAASTITGASIRWPRHGPPDNGSRAAHRIGRLDNLHAGRPPARATAARAS